MGKWTLLSNHGHVFLYLAQEPDARLRDVAASVGITERAVQKIVRDLQDGGFLRVSKRGRRNHYRIHSEKPLRHPLEAHCSAGQLVDLITDPGRTEPAGRPENEGATGSGAQIESSPQSAEPAPPPDGPDSGEQGSLF